MPPGKPQLRTAGWVSAVHPRRIAAFTLVELVIVVAIIGILASLLMSALTTAKEQGRKASCISNFRQLQLAWQMYVDDDHIQRFPHNSTSEEAGQYTDFPNWVAGVIQRRDNWPDNTNTVKLIQSIGGLGQYLAEPKVFRCPSARSRTRINGKLHAYARSVSMNSYMNGEEFKLSNLDPTSWHYTRLSDLVAHTPSETGWVFIDSHEDSISLGRFLVSPPYWPGWANVPAARHNGGATLSFSDGHVICHRWRDPRTRFPVTGTNVGDLKQPGNPDPRWLQERATAVKPGGLIYK